MFRRSFLKAVTVGLGAIIGYRAKNAVGGSRTVKPESITPPSYVPSMAYDLRIGKPFDSNPDGTVTLRYSDEAKAWVSAPARITRKHRSGWWVTGYYYLRMRLVSDCHTGRIEIVHHSGEDHLDVGDAGCVYAKT